MLQKNKLLKINIFIIFLILISSVQALVVVKQNKIINEEPSKNNRGYFSWEDFFNDSSKIDPAPPGVGLTDNYVIENGQVKMKNTYSIWTDPSWTRMKPIQIINNAGTPITNCVLQINISYDSDMQSDYDDIRFKHEILPSTWLDYWLETFNLSKAVFWVKIPYLQTGNSNMYLFYSNPSANSESNFDNVFSWEYTWGNDYKITNKLNVEGAWDPDIAFGSNRFFVAWEEGTTVPIRQEIRGTMFDINGNVVVSEFEIFSDGLPYPLQFRNENPSIAFGGGKFFVAWEHYGTQSGVTNPTTMDIKGRTVTIGGGLGPVINICTASNCQADPNVEFDSVNNRFCVVWEDARNGMNNYNIYGRLYDTNGNPVGSEKIICDAANSQCEPWVAFDPINQRYLIVWEDGETADNGPFDIYAGLFDKNLNPLNSPVKLADGNQNIDYNFPCVEFCKSTQSFLVTWNDGDISNNIWYGNIWGAILDTSGNVITPGFLISSGNYIRTDIVPFFDTLFFVTYDGYNKIYGKLVSSNGTHVSNNILVSIGGNADADWANAAVGAERIFVTWEDERIPTSNLPDSYGNILRINSPGVSVSIIIGAEEEIVLNAHITSIEIEPSNLTIWDKFVEISTRGNIVFDVLNGVTGVLIVHNISSGYNLSGLSVDSIRLMATFTRANPSSTPSIDMWGVSYFVNDPPFTPSDPNPADGAINVDVQADLSWTGGDPNGNTVTYDVYFGVINPPPKIVSNQSLTTFDPGTLSFVTIYYWRIVAWDFYGDSSTGPVWSFTTRDNNPPNTPSNPNPANGSNNIVINPILSWDCSDPNPGDTLTYDVYFGTSDPPTIMVSANQTSNSYYPGTLNFFSTYYWRIVAWDNYGASTIGPVWHFTTKVNNPPNTPYNPNPVNGAVNVVITTNISWQCVDPDGDNLTYNVFFGETSPPPKVSDNQTVNSYDPPGLLDFSTTYYWQIVAYDEYSDYTNGPIWYFTTKANDPPNIWGRNPANESTNVDINAVVSWQGNDPDGDIVTYDVYFGTVESPPKVVTNQSETFFNPGQMSFNTTYYWKLVAWDDKGAFKEELIWWFKTKEKTNTPPNTPTIYCDGIIMNLFVFIKSNVEYEFDLVASDSDGDNIYYFIDWGDGSSTSWLGPFPTSEHIFVTHTWSTNMKFGTIKAKVKDVHDSESGETNLYYLTIKNRNFGENRIIERFLQRFNLIKYFLYNSLLVKNYIKNHNKLFKI